MNSALFGSAISVPLRLTESVSLEVSEISLRSSWPNSGAITKKPVPPIRRRIPPIIISIAIIVTPIGLLLSNYFFSKESTLG